MGKKYITIALVLAVFCVNAVEYKKKKLSEKSKVCIAALGAIGGGITAGYMGFLSFFIKQAGDSELQLVPRDIANVTNMSQWQFRHLQRSERLYSVARIINRYGIALVGLSVGVLAIRFMYNNCFEVQYNCAVDCINNIKKHPQLKNNRKIRKKMIKAYNLLYSFSKSNLLNKLHQLEVVVILRDLKKLILLPPTT